MSTLVMASQLRRRWVAIALGIVLVPVAAAGSAGSMGSAGPAGTARVASTTTSGPSGITATLLSRGTIAKPFEAEAAGIELEADRVIDVAVVHFALEPLGTTGWHVHPGPAVVTVKEGTVTLTHRNGRSTSYQSGQTFIEAGPRDLVSVRNTGGTPAQVVVTFFVPTGVELATPKPAPTGCSA
jgi:hypothetical protein